jgi:dihydroxyacetone kinase
MKKLINDVHAVVPEMLAGVARLHPGIALVDGEQIAVRADVEALTARGEVALVSGGGAGHEPAHAGYVGPGMLTAAVAGDVFTSPSTDAVLAAIRSVAGPGGVLLIVKNYTGDRLNFGLAAEIARTEGIAVEMVVVADDVALAASDRHAGRRGLAGTVLVHKVAGAAAAAGLPLAGVRQAALDAIASVGTMGVALTPCTVPAAGRPGFELGPDEIELGLGIHGEAGVRRARIGRADDLVEQMLSAIIDDRRLRAGDRVALLVNNLGGTPSLELSIVTGAALGQLAARGLIVERAWTGSFLTALEMAGVSLSLMALDDERLARLDAPTRAPAWPAAHVGRVARQPARLPAPGDATGPSAGPAARAIDHPLASTLRSVCAALSAAEDELTRLDQAVGDGDLGISLARGARAVERDLAQYPLHDPAATLRALSATLRRALGGTSGPLYAIALLRAAVVFERAGDASLGRLAAALRAAGDGIAEVGDARRGDCTMLDALIPAAEALETAARSGAGLGEALQRCIEAAEKGAAATAHLVPRRGRSSYLGERAIGYPDPGAMAVVVWLKALTPSSEISPRAARAR